MPQPQPHPQPHRLRRRGNQSNFSFLRNCSLIILVIGFFLVLLLVVTNDNNVSDDKNVKSIPSRLNTKGSRSKSTISYQKLRLPNEETFTKTVKECSDIHNCGHHKVTVNNASDSIQRIAIISPPSKALEVITTIIKSALIAYYDHDVGTMNAEIEIIRTTHVPPYGYGKSHGYTKIIRVMTNPLLLQVIGSLYALKSHHLFVGDEQLKQLLRQVIRWNCRLSHVAAHTTMINMDVSSTHIVQEMKDVVRVVIEDPETELNGQHQIIHENQLSDAYQIIDQSNIDGQLSYIMKESLDHFDTLYPTNDKDDKWIEYMSNALKKELESTNNLQKWPCKSFWDVSSEGDDHEMDKLTKEMAGLISPSCSDPFTKCGVKRDRCEEEGDAKCL